MLAIVPGSVIHRRTSSSVAILFIVQLRKPSEKQEIVQIHLCCIVNPLNVTVTIHMTVRIETHTFAIWRDLFFKIGQTVLFFRASARKTKKNSSHRTWAIRWASAALALSSACGPSAPVLIDGALIGLWVMPPTTGSIEIERGGAENITINQRKRWRR